jgi:hypothetical protein
MDELNAAICSSNMLLTLRHLLVMVALALLSIGLTALSANVGRAATLPEGVSALGGLIAGCLGSLTIGWLLFRLLRLRPIGLPRCPHCGKLHGNYHVPADAWPTGILVCVWCGELTRYHMSRKKPLVVPADIPSLYLYWPEIFGFWRRNR